MLPFHEAGQRERKMVRDLPRTSYRLSESVDGEVGIAT
jgi:hypothetical protein